MNPNPNPNRKIAAAAITAALVLALLSACGAADSTGAKIQIPKPSPTPTVAACVPNPAVPAPSVDTAFDDDLHDELIAMLDDDQAERTGASTTVNGDEARTIRLAKIISDHGWPTIPMVGDDGEDAAWAIAQHSDQDPDFQCVALEYLRDAVEAGVASPGNLAYLEDRVAVAAGRPQLYGTQVSCGPDGTPQPQTPIDEQTSVEVRRAEAGLEPIADYYAEMAEICAEDG